MRDKHGASEHEVVLPIGVIDDPANQTQQVASINLTEGSALVIGASQFGKPPCCNC